MKDYIIKSLENYFAGKEESAVIEWSDEECFDYKSDEITLLVKDKEGKSVNINFNLFLSFATSDDKDYFRNPVNAKDFYKCWIDYEDNSYDKLFEHYKSIDKKVLEHWPKFKSYLAKKLNEYEQEDDCLTFYAVLHPKANLELIKDEFSKDVFKAIKNQLTEKFNVVDWEVVRLEGKAE